MSKILLTGGLGFIGHTIVRKLEDTNHTPIIVDNKSDYDGAIDRAELEAPQLKINPLVKEINGFVMNDFELIGYNSYASIKAPMAV